MQTTSREARQGRNGTRVLTVLAVSVALALLVWAGLELAYPGIAAN